MQAPVVLKKLLWSIAAVWLLLSAVFMLSRMMPGTLGEDDILQGKIGYYSHREQASRTQAYQQLLERTGQNLPLFYFGLENPLKADNLETSYSYLLPKFDWNGTHNQYHLWATELLTGNLGRSYLNSRPVADIITEAAGTTFPVIIISFLLTIGITFFSVTYVAQASHAPWRKPFLASMIVLDSIPLFVLSLLLLLLFANPDFLQLFPVFGLGLNLGGAASNWWLQVPYLVLPVTCLALSYLPYLANQFYTAVRETLQAPYIKTARAKGLPEAGVIKKHAFKNALLPVITTLTDMLPALVAGSVVVETIFALPGVGRLLVNSVVARDFPVIIGIVVIIALVKMLSNVLADLAYTIADPRIRKGSA